MRPLCLLAILVLGSCMPKPVLKPHEEVAGRAAWDAWRLKKLPVPVHGHCNAGRFYVVTPTPDDFSKYCPMTNWKKVAGCLSWRTSHHFFAWSEYPVVVVSPKHYSEPTIIVHELLHAYTHCAELSTNPWDPGDGDHKDPRVWSAAGGRDAAQSIADDLAVQRLDGGT